MWGIISEGSVWELFYNCYRTVHVSLEMLYNEQLEHFWNCSKTVLKCSCMIQGHLYNTIWTNFGEVF